MEKPSYVEKLIQFVGMGLLLLCFPDRYGPLQESVGPNEGLVAEAISGGISECGWAILDSGHGYAAAWDFAFKGEGFRHCWWAFDDDGYTAWAFDYDGYTGRLRPARAVQEPAESPSAQAYPSSPIDGGHQFLVPGPTPESKADPQLLPRNFVMVVHLMWRPPPPPTMPLGPAGSTDVAAVPPGADVTASSDTNTYKYPGCGGMWW